MGYTLVDTYSGERSLNYLATLATTLQLQESLTGYEATSNDTEAVRRLFQPHLKHLLDGQWQFAMVVVVKLQGHLPVHRDGALPNGTKRHHLVLQTNPRYWDFVDGQWLQLKQGGIYEFDPTKEHGAINWGAEAGIRLVVDIVI